MRIQFGLGRTFVAIAVAAVLMASAAQPLTFLNSLVFYLWIAVLTVWSALAACTSEKSSGFFRTAVTASLIYVAAASFEQPGQKPTRVDPPHFPLPHRLVVRMLLPDIKPPTAFSTNPEILKFHAQTRWAIAVVSLTFGIATASATTLWQQHKNKASPCN